MSPDEAAATKEVYDYVIVSIKSLPEVYDMASIIANVVTPEHTCILVNSTQAVGVEEPLEERFPNNIVLSVVCGADVTQLGPSEFEHKGSTQVWVGPANQHPTMASIQTDMAHALELTLVASAQVDCKVSKNIRQQQYERVAGPIAFHPLSIIFETPNHQALLEKPSVRDLVLDMLDEILNLAAAQGCQFASNFKQKTIEEMTRPGMAESVMWQDYVARRPMEVETFLGAPIQVAKDLKLSLPRIETIYAILRHANTMNQQRPRGEPVSPQATSPLPRNTPNGAPMPRPMPNGMPNGMGRPPQPRQRGMSHNGQRRPQMNGPPPNGYRPSAPPSVVGGYGSRQASRRGSMEGADLEEFSHLVHYGEDGLDPSLFDRSDMSIRERPNQQGWDQRSHSGHPQQRRPMGPGMGPGPVGPSRMGPPGPQSRRPPQQQQPMPRHGPQMYEDEDDDFMPFDPSGGSGPPMIDPDNFDMMSVTSRKNRKIPAPGQTQAQFRKNAEVENSMMSRGGRFRPSFGRRDRSSQAVSVAPLGDNILDDPMMSYSSNRYGTVDRGVIAESRTNSLTSQRLDELQYGPGPGGPGMGGPNGVPRRTSQSPATHFNPQMRGAIPNGNGNGGPMPNGRPSPPGGSVSMPSPGGYHSNGRPSPSELGRQQNGRFPNGNLGPADQHLGSSSHSPLQSASISLTGSASASANSGDTQTSSSEQSAASQGGRLAVGVR
jgi:2-dehydropantoate 2-reductase